LEERLKSDRQEIECDISYEMVNVRNLIDDAVGQIDFNQPPEFNRAGEYPTAYYDMAEIARLAVSKPTNINQEIKQEQTMSNDKIWRGDRVDGDKVMGDKVAGNKMQIHTVQGDAIAGDKIVNTQNMTQTAQDIKVLVNQYASDYDTTTPSGKMGLSGKVIESIEKNPTLKDRTLNALKQAGKTAFEEAIDHPVAKVLVAGLEGYLE
jgi:hypothetical protein